MSTLIRATGGRAEIESWPEMAVPGTRATAGAGPETASYLAVIGMRSVPAGAAFRMGSAPGVKTPSHAGTAPGKGKAPKVSPRGPAAAAAAPSLCPAAVTAWIGAGPGLNEPAGFAVDLDRVLTVLPRRNFPPPHVTGPAPRSRWSRGRGRWSGVPFGGMGWPSVSRIWARGKGQRSASIGKLGR